MLRLTTEKRQKFSDLLKQEIEIDWLACEVQILNETLAYSPMLSEVPIKGETMIRLTTEERQKFSDWLKQEIETDRQLLKQLEKLPHPKGMTQLKENEIRAKLILINSLDSTELQIIG